MTAATPDQQVRVKLTNHVHWPKLLIGAPPDNLTSVRIHENAYHQERAFKAGSIMFLEGQQRTAQAERKEEQRRSHSDPQVNLQQRRSQPGRGHSVSFSHGRRVYPSYAENARFPQTCVSIEL